MSDKIERRKFFRALRKDLKNPAADQEITRRVLQAFGGEYDSFFVYLSFGSEVGTEELVRGLLAAGKKVCVPKVVGERMKSVPYTDKLQEGAFGILEPEDGEEWTCQVALTPMLAVDKEGYRLGYGGGFYDRYFAAHPDILRIGIAYEGQFTVNLPREETDMPLDALVTEKCERYFGKRLCAPSKRING